jgi:hypothetical protein
MPSATDTAVRVPPRKAATADEAASTSAKCKNNQRLDGEASAASALVGTALWRMGVGVMRTFDG